MAKKVEVMEEKKIDKISMEKVDKRLDRVGVVISVRDDGVNARGVRKAQMNFKRIEWISEK